MSLTRQDSRVDADEIIRTLALASHPEGGHYAETWRDQHSSAIYFLLRAGEHSHWHRVDATEVWHYYAGDPLLLETAPPSGNISGLRLGASIETGERPQATVLPNHWQRARSLGAWTLVGCTVAPGFTFEGFTLAAPDFSPARPESD
jgi:predicted cupin superfamily sugar epimerase